MKSDRLFEIIYLLLNNKQTTAAYLAENFEVSQRTIYRDIDTLTLAGIPIYTEKGKGGGIRLLPDFTLNKSLLNEKEQNDILSALQSISKIKAANTMPVIQKLSALFNKKTENWLEIDFSEWGSSDEKVFHSIRTAILEKRIVHFDYYSTYGEKTERSLEPIQLWFKARTWYVKGYCLTKQDVRIFRLTRIRNIRLSIDYFLTRDVFAISEKPRNDKFVKQMIKIVVRIAPEMVYRVFDEFGDAPAERQEDGSYIVTVIWPEDEWVYGTILSYGEYIDILEPEHVKEIVKEKAQKVIKKYS
ncbi:MAG: YafY family transcriptional regulator [Erysipelotrichales bacterium]|nr:YafY family transcriptional regulator [Erysipelotrichales bacterium]